MSETFGERIKRLRVEKGWTQAQLAKKVNYCAQIVTKWEHDTSFPSYSALLNLSNIFKVSLHYLLTGSEFND